MSLSSTPSAWLRKATVSRVGPRGNFQPHAVAEFALVENFLNLLAIRSCTMIVADRDVGIARDAERGTVHDALAGENCSAYVPPRRLRAGSYDSHDRKGASRTGRASGRAGMIANRDCVSPWRGASRTATCSIWLRKSGKSSGPVDRHRRQDRRHFVAEELGDNLFLAFVQVRTPPKRRTPAWASWGSSSSRKQRVLVHRHAVHAPATASSCSRAVMPDGSASGFFLVDRRASVRRRGP